MVVDASLSWFGSLFCCHPSSPRPQGFNPEKDTAVWSDEPGFTSPPALPEAASLHRTSRRSHSVRRRTRGHRPKTSLSQSLFSLSSRRPQISAPSNFRHLQSDTFVFPPLTPEPDRPLPLPLPVESSCHDAPFHPLDLSIYRSHKRLSPLVPLDGPALNRGSAAGHDDDYDDGITVPLPAHVRGGSDASDASTTLHGSASAHVHERSYSSVSFHVPRRPLPEGACVGSAGSFDGRAKSVKSARSIKSTKSARSDWPDRGHPHTPPVPVRSRLRALSSPAAESMVERIASAMIEMDRLQAEIDSVIERQSIYANSRPSTAHGEPGQPEILGLSVLSGLSSLSGLGVGSCIPALPPAAPSFAERLSTERPKTAPPRHSAIVEAAAAPALSLTIPAPLMAPMAVAKSAADVPMAPPLPLVLRAPLRPPLRKKKSFSRVSHWLFPGQSTESTQSGEGAENVANLIGGHIRGISLDSVTNLPRPVKEKDGYYQCVPPPRRNRDGALRTSLDTISTVDTLSTWTTEREAGPALYGTVVAGYEDTRGQESPSSDRDGPGPLVNSSSSSSSLSSLASHQDTPTAATNTATPTTATTMTPVAAMAPPVSKAAALVSAIGHRPQSVGVAF